MAAGGDGDRDTLLSRLLDHCALRPGDAFATFYEGAGAERALSWEQLAVAVARQAEHLGSQVQAGETVFLLLPLGPEVLAAFLGCMAAGAIPALLSYPSSKVAPEVYARNLRGVLETTRAMVLLTTRALEAPLRDALPPGRRLLWIEDVAGGGGDPGGIAAGVGADSVALLQHTSGSTGIQKGVALTHRAVLNQVRHYSSAIALDSGRDRVVSWLPLYHDMGLIATFLMPLASGTPVVLMDPFRWVVDPALLLEAVHRYRGTLCWLPNFAYVHMARRIGLERSQGLELGCVRGFINCSEPVRHASHRAFLERFEGNGVREDMLWVCYAMAENTFAVTQAGGATPGRLDWIDPAALATDLRAVPAPAGSGLPMVSCGPPIEGCEVRVVDEARVARPERAIGEVALRSDSMLAGYHHDPAATAGAIADGFYFTGDLGYLAEGQLYITGRKKDLLIVGGRNFYPTDLEDVVSEVEGVVPGRTAALGIEDTEAGTEQVVLLTETELPSGTAQEALKRSIQRAVLERLDCPVARVLLVPRGWIIKTSSGKVARRANREKYLALAGAAPSPAASPPVAPLPAVLPERSLLVLAGRVVVAALILTLAVLLRPGATLVLYQRF